ncbi:hypothetical protein KKH23_01315 [Patescibacteria group bacterium]|nr:hypothetical protein [Patescibacteria group bacterium]MBU0777131.1 hypothetical protein [Patescibacteria group bacterium]MBU0845825.1 hypothetical protein [Patescibacteria group bacterium]MBU1066415.1 hypothetical protein [Patescibacteria group bacterium]MBU1844475.1 hypothetical protein [Patescibacteria group bacterium]
MNKTFNVLVIIGVVSLMLGAFLMSRYSPADSERIIAILLFAGGLVLLSITNIITTVSDWLSIIDKAESQGE